MRLTVKHMGIAALLALAAGCAGDQQFVAQMNSLVGQLTYEQALERWGPPAQVEQAKRLKTARWRWNYSEYVRELTLWFNAGGIMTKWKERTYFVRHYYYGWPYYPPLHRYRW